MYKYNLRVNGEYLIENAALPKNATVTGTDMVRAGGGSSLEIVCAAKGPVTLTAGKEVSIRVLHGRDGENFAALPVSATVTIQSGNTNFNDGDIIARLTLPYDCLPLIKANLATTDTAAAGNFDLFLAYLPR